MIVLYIVSITWIVIIHIFSWLYLMDRYKGKRRQILKWLLFVPPIPIILLLIEPMILCIQDIIKSWKE